MKLWNRASCVIWEERKSRQNDLNNRVFHEHTELDKLELEALL